jgi:uncharacterized protein with ATP-grasp and redox domains
MRPEPAPPALPPELLNNDPNGFAWGVWHDRTPKLVAQLRDASPYGPRQRRALDALLEEIASGLMQPLGPDAHDHEAWASWGADYFGKRWLDAPFLWSESYFFRRVLDATGFFEPGPWRCVDPFEQLKTAELDDPALDRDLARLDDLQQLPPDEQAHAKLLGSLWGNRFDLGFTIGETGGPPQAASAGLVADHEADLWPYLNPAADVVLVTDNAGRELLADLVLIDHLLQHGHAATVTLHVKPYPYYVSDATTADVVTSLVRLSRTPGVANEIWDRLRSWASDATLSLYTHDFYCAPWSYRRMPDDLAARFEQASLTIVKGDLNYRRLVGDRDWPPTTPFTDAAAYFPAPVAALRTLKSDVVTGVEPTTLAGLDSTGQPWRTDGRNALIQVLPRR